VESAPDEFEISVEDGGEISFVRVTGELDLANHRELAAELRHLADKGKPIVVDLTDCKFIDSSGIQALLAGNEHAKTFAVVAPEGQVRQVFELAGLIEALSIHRSAEEAANALR
jgi:anti-anti-sigma factor